MEMGTIARLVVTQRMRKKKSMKVVVASGYFDPIHVGHIEYLELAAKQGDWLVVIVNNDKQAKIKKGKSFMSEEDRVKIVSSLECVDEAFLSIDSDSSVCKSIEEIKPHIFAKGGDRFSNEIPEAEVCRKLKVKIVDNLGEKIRSSSKFTGIKEKKKSKK